MAKYFEGTSTKEKYEVGETYSNSRGDFRANEDGSFTKLGNVVGKTDAGKTIRDNSGGQVSRGSAGNPDVKWYASGGDRVGPNKQTSGITTSLGRDSDNGPAYDQAGQLVTQVNNPARMRAAGGFTGAAVRTAAWSGDQTEPQDLLIGGNHMVANPNYSNADLAEIRYSDIGGNLIGLLNLGADIGHNLAWRMGPEYYKADVGGRLNIIGKMGTDALGSLPKPNIDLDLGSAIRSDIVEPDRRFHDGWVSYDEGNTWAFEGISNPWR